MTVLVVPEARSELRAAVDYYESQADGLGKKLWLEVEEHLAWIAHHHTLPRLRPGGYRRVNLRVFPYLIAYMVRGDAIWILAIAHSHREPDFWIKRRVQ